MKDWAACFTFYKARKSVSLLKNKKKKTKTGKSLKSVFTKLKPNVSSLIRQGEWFILRHGIHFLQSTTNNSNPLLVTMLSMRIHVDTKVSNRLKTKERLRRKRSIYKYSKSKIMLYGCFPLMVYFVPVTQTPIFLI